MSFKCTAGVPYCGHPGCKDSLSLKRGSSSARPCHLCTVRSSELCRPRPIPIQAPLATKIICEMIFNSHRKIDWELAIHKYSVLPMLAVPDAFPMEETHSRVDIYAIYQIELMHILSPGKIKMIKEYRTNLLDDSEWTKKNKSTSMGNF